MPESAAWLRESVYLDELARQATIATDAHAAAWKRAMTADTEVQDLTTWSHLQAALFAGIVVARLLKPGRVHDRPGLEKGAAYTVAAERAAGLRESLEIDKNSPLFSVTRVRDALEHFDERIDAVLNDQAATCIVDWYISDGTALVTPPAATADPELAGVGLRAFYPAGGLLLFDREQFDLFAWDIALLDLREQVGRVKAAAPAPTGRSKFGGVQAVALLAPEDTRRRCQQWLDLRDQAGAGLGVNLR